MREVADRSVQIAIGSPPFTDHSDGKTLEKKSYLRFIGSVFSEIWRVLEPGGLWICVNSDLRDHARYNHGNRRFNGLVWQKHSSIRYIAESIGFRCIDLKIWAKSLRQNVYRYGFAYIQFFKKSDGNRATPTRTRVSDSFSPDVWLLEGGTYRRDSRGYVFRDAFHPEIVSRCLEQFTSRGDLVLSPFAGSGTVPAIARLLGRRCIAYETNHSLKPLIQETIASPELYPAFLSLVKMQGLISVDCRRSITTNSQRITASSSFKNRR